MITRVTDHYKYNPKYPVNHAWPEKVSYDNPIRAGLCYQGNYWFSFKLQSGEMTNNKVKDPWHESFENLNWSNITTIVIGYGAIG